MLANLNEIVVFARIKVVIVVPIISRTLVLGLVKHLLAFADHVREELSGLLHFSPVLDYFDNIYSNLILL